MHRLRAVLLFMYSLPIFWTSEIDIIYLSNMSVCAIIDKLPYKQCLPVIGRSCLSNQNNYSEYLTFVYFCDILTTVKI